MSAIPSEKSSSPRSKPAKIPAADRPTLRAAQRVLASADFQRIYAARKSSNTSEVTVAYCANGLGYSRLGVSVGVKHGNAVRRARIKRVFRAAFREARHALPTGFDYVLIPRKGVVEYTSVRIEKALIEAAKRVR
ncbi:MAG: ribonuclease P protein component [Planctomycetota bacterium]